MTDRVAAEIVKEARQRAGLTQGELAERAGITQSVVSLYESARRQPSLPVLQHLVEAAGYELSLRIEHLPQPLAALRGPIGCEVRRLREPLLRAARAQGSTTLRVVGAVARGTETDVDVPELVAEMPRDGLVGREILRAELEIVLGRRIHLLIEPARRRALSVRL